MILFFCVNNLFAQKPIIDSIAYKEWPSLEPPTISKNGKYVFYIMKNVPVGSKTLVVQSTDGKWKKEFKGGMKDGSQILSNKYFLFINKNDSLGMLILGTDLIKYIPNVPWYSIHETKEGEYFCYPSGSNSKILMLKNLKTDKEKVFTDVDSWYFDEDMLILFKPIYGSNQRQSINLADLTTGKAYKIWEGYKPENLIQDAKHRQFAFKTGDSVYYYKIGNPKAICIINESLANVNNGLGLGDLDSFTDDGQSLFTSLLGKKGMGGAAKLGDVEVWSYNDERLQSDQEREFYDEKYLAVINILDRKIIQLQYYRNEEFQFPKSGGTQGTLALIQNDQGDSETWRTTYKSSWSLISLKNGERQDLSFLDNVITVKLSPCGRYLVYFDNLNGDCFSYEILTSTIRNLTKGIQVPWVDIYSDDRLGRFGKVGGNRGLATWAKNDEYLLVYDRYDIWKLDPLKKEIPINLTNGYGRKHQIVFNYTFESNEGKIINEDEKLNLTAFNKENKNNGFFLKQLNKSGDPEFLHMGPYLYKTNSGYVEDDGTPPMKAKNADVYIVRRMSATDAPNYFSTKDFKTYIRLSDLQPQKKYNWYTTELHTWKSLDGRKLQGILYKPENFDPNKKYPVIFYYYERKSDGLNAYIKPEVLCVGCAIDIPTYVSRGYLVFSPDIYYKIGDPMQGTYDAIVSAANYVSTLSFVNAKKLGLQGCSFGGIQTNYLVTHTNLFAAAESSSGIADWVSTYGSLIGRKSSQQSYYEAGQPRIGASLWEKPEAYIRSSPIFQVHKVTSPLLMMHTKEDGICPYTDAIGFFSGLRRMGKKVWMLVYSEGNHGVWGKEADDFSVRMMQFFDHYLKDKPAPIWMLKRVTAESKNGKSDLELDTTGRTPGSGLLTLEEQAKVDSLMTRKPITVILK